MSLASRISEIARIDFPELVERCPLRMSLSQMNEKESLFPLDFFFALRRRCRKKKVRDRTRFLRHVLKCPGLAQHRARRPHRTFEN